MISKLLYKNSLRKECNLLLVIAHPDDEAMFFGPLLSSSCNVSILCLSNGNYKGLGMIRSKELFDSGMNYNISNENITIIDHTDLQDGNTNWSTDLIADIIIDNINNIDTIITFDNYGVSGHPNHISTYKGVILAHKRLIERQIYIKILILNSVSIIRKFLGLFDIIISLLLSKNIVISLNFLLIWNGMASHSSQFVWYRKLFIIFSRYSYINTFTLIEEEK